MASKLYTIEQLKNVVVTSRSWRDVALKLGLKSAGGNARTLKKLANKHQIDYKHFLGKGWNLGGTSKNEKSIAESFIKNSIVSKTSIKKKILKHKLIDYKCFKCGVLDKWKNEKLILHIDHINRDCKDNRIKNLRFLCPNCHSQTKTYCRDQKNYVSNKNKCKNCGRNIFKNKTGLCKFCWGKKKILLRDLLISKEDLIKKIQNTRFKNVCLEIKVCEGVLRRICREENINVPNSRSSIPECKMAAINRSRKFHVEKNVLEKLILDKSFCEIGKMFNVSDNAIRKRCKLMGINFRKDNGSVAERTTQRT